MQVQTESDFDRLARATKLLAVASAWNELGLWDILAQSQAPVDLTDLPGNARALAISAAVLAHAGLLDGDGRKWAMSRVARELYTQGALPTPKTLDWMGDLTRMTEVLRGGGPVRGPDGRSRVTSGGVQPDNREASRNFLDMLYRRSHASAEASAEWLSTRLAAGAHVLDLGGGHGRYAAAFKAKGFRVTLFDFPLVIDLARERHGDAFAYHAGNFHQDDLGGPYDAVFLSNIVHGEAPEGNLALINRVHQALSPRGWVVFKDMFIDEQGRNPEIAAFFGITMLFYTAGGRSYGLGDVAAWCQTTGFAPIEAIGVDTFSLVFAQKAH